MTDYNMETRRIPRQRSAKSETLSETLGRLHLTGWLVATFAADGTLRELHSSALPSHGQLGVLHDAAHGDAFALPDRATVQRHGSHFARAVAESITGHRAVLVAWSEGSASPSLRRIRESTAIERGLQAIADASSRTNDEPFRLRRPPAFAAVLVDRDGEVHGRWLADVAQGTLAGALLGEDKRLSPLIERNLRALLAQWSWSSAGGCPPTEGWFGPEMRAHVLPFGLHLLPSEREPIVALVSLSWARSRPRFEAFGARYKLSSRECEVAHALLEGFHVAEIAEMLSIAETTTQDHVKHILAKTASKNRAEMVAKLLGWEAPRGARGRTG